VPPHEWKFRQSIDYSITCNLAILDLASKMKENFLYNRYVMGKNSIARGSTDTWTAAPHRYAAIQAELARGAGAGPGAAGAAGGAAGAGAAGAGAAAAGGRGGRGGRGGADEGAMWAALRRPADRDPRAYILPSTQRDFTTATRFINALLETGIKVHRATREFQAAGKTYPAGSFVVVTAQAFRPHVIDMFEPQDHPDNFPSPGAPPTRPYDNAGWTLAFQMGIEFDRILDAFTIPSDFTVVTDWNVAPPPAPPPPAVSTGFYTMSPAQIDSFVAVNRLLAAGASVRRMGSGEFVVQGTNTSLPILRTMASERGVRVQSSPQDFGSTGPLAKRRIGLWDQYGGSMDAGWARWILEQFEFPFTRVFAPELDAGNLIAKYDTLIFVDGSIPAVPGGGGGGGRGGGAGAGGGTGPANIPEEYRNQIGSVSAERTIPQLRAFVEQGGTIVVIGASATNLGRHFGLPIESHLMENGQPLTTQKYYVPGSVLRARINPMATQDIAAGMQPETDFFFDNSPVWKPEPIAAAQNIRVIASFDSKTPLRSGWAWGQQYLDRGVIAVAAAMGSGRVVGHVVLLAPEILQRGQPHATFKLLFNSIYLK
jgi:hypothetical protein